MAVRLKMFLGIAAIVLVGAVVALGLLRSRQQPRFPYMGQPLGAADYEAMAGKPGWRAQTINVAPGVALHGLLREPATPGAPWVVFFNGNSSQVLREGQQFLDALCAENGWGGIVWAYRGYDSSGGEASVASLEEDGFKVYSKLLADRKIRPDAVHVVGFSLGTGIAAAVAAKARENPPASLTLLAPMTWLYLGGRTQLRLHRYETSKWLPGIESPTLVVHGVLDATLPVESGRSVAKSLGTRAELLELPGLGHYELPMSPAAQDALRSFIRRHAADAVAPPATP